LIEETFQDLKIYFSSLNEEIISINEEKNKTMAYNPEDIKNKICVAKSQINNIRRITEKNSLFDSVSSLIKDLSDYLDTI
jgi:hypothetical protein